MYKLGFLKAMIGVSIVAVILLSVYAVFFLSPSFTGLITENTEAEAVRVATHLSKMVLDGTDLDGMELTKKNLPDNIILELEKVAKDFELIKVKLFSPTGEVIYSSDTKDIGQINKKSYFHEVVARGRTYTNVVKKDSRSLEDQLMTRDNVETYVPVMKGDSFLGAFEIYFDITTTKKKLDRLVRQSHIFSLSIALALVIIMIFLSHKATKSIIAQASAKTRDIEDGHQRLLTVLNSLDAGVYVTDLETYEVLFLNKYLRDIFGDVIGKTCWQVFHPDQAGPCDYCSDQKSLIANGESLSVNVREIFNSSTQKWYEIRSRVIRWLDDRFVRLEIAADITDRKNDEIELRRAHQEMGKFCEITKQIGMEQSLDGVGNFLIKELKDILNTQYMQLFVFSSDKSNIFTLSDTGAGVIKEPEQVHSFSTIIENLENVITGFDMPLKSLPLPDDLPLDGRQTLIPFRIENHTQGALVVTCTQDCLCDDNKLKLVALILEQASGSIKRAVLHQEEIRFLEQRIESMSEFSGIIGKDPKMQTIYKLIEDIAHSDTTVLIQGETGTGKEVVARALYKKSLRKDNPLVVINCSAYPSTLLESELFGHEKGAFTGAIRKKMGRFEQADGGTVFLDEIGEIPLPAQIKLLRVLQTQKFERLGGEQTVAVNVRILAATNKDLLQEVKDGNFREDLYYRLNVIPIHLPPLRNRRNDIPLLARHFQKKFAAEHGVVAKGFSSEAMRVLLDYYWPGNVRELENTTEHAVVLSKGQRTEVGHLPSILISGDALSPAAGLKRSRKTIEDNEKKLLIDVLEECNWNKSQAALRLGISRSSLYSKLKKYQVSKPTRL
ncbi:MAG: sigma 54-interacting transcriptional regulator [Desulfobacterales bacterium]|nr:sigma 54-interacting transcriptional regulator [Desulfobacterales bacterium]